MYQNDLQITFYLLGCYSKMKVTSSLPTFTCVPNISSKGQNVAECRVVSQYLYHQDSLSYFGLSRSIIVSVLDDNSLTLISLFDNNIAIVFDVIEGFVFVSRDITVSFGLYSFNDISLNCCDISIQEQILTSSGVKVLSLFKKG